ncbi:YiiX/YebB-like N1pC/P60 family cysteine hydrolase [Tamlana flava]|uniref:YiiX/YebB-like N1pC/P60 family cysteine hydrolase n=1 Tax=Tamlana flava TaxID=3158572 RepID=UPI00351B29B1
MKKLRLFFITLIALYLILLIPFTKDNNEIYNASKTPFNWNQDALWVSLEKSFQRAKEMQSFKLDSLVEKLTIETDVFFSDLENTVHNPDDTIYGLIEKSFFKIAPLIAAQKIKSDWYLKFYNRIRKKLKEDSKHWDMSSPIARNTSYRILYGMRAATEEILLQTNDNEFISKSLVTDEPSITPFVNVFGIKVHSGDLLVSRGGAEVSAFISRGNDYPGNFSHVALIHIDKETNAPYFVEAHIERGVAISNLNEYLKDKKLRFMVLRPRFDLQEITSNPSLPYEASKFIFDECQTRHISYDFKMDYHDDSAMFCSEVGSYAYKHYGINLWEFQSTISSNGIINWLHDFGVNYFLTQMPSDLEYDPALSVVGEWRNKETLFQDHIDNAVMDALIGEANNGKKLDYNLWALPIARLVKGYCFIQNTFGIESIIPEGMDAVTALKNNYFVEQFQNLKFKTIKKVEQFKKERGYLPPYWQLVRMAEESI